MTDSPNQNRPQGNPPGNQPAEQPGNPPPAQRPQERWYTDDPTRTLSSQPASPPANQPGNSDPTRTLPNQPAAPSGQPPYRQSQPYGQQPPAGQPPAYGQSQPYMPPGSPSQPQPYAQQPAPAYAPAPAATGEPAVATAAPAATKKRSRRKSLFWAGFAVGFLLLASVSCGGIATFLGLNRLTLADLRGGTGPAWTPMPVTPTAVVEQPAEGAPVAAVSTRFAAGDTVRNLTNSRVNVRSSPGYLGKSAADVVGSLAPAESFAILGESAAADNLTWWRIRTTGAVEGWVAEATASGVQILGPAQ